ncbi:heavy metal-associated isoprenylated plant protein 7-like isoform X1 [Primulina eburnea]|uniref:heavy metal-associated isoprenylated plant protein 7-like isoform X1 n=1 Tax=Primulina eburnea TaxID=1245227 RepID=UPI003C6C4099
MQWASQHQRKLARKNNKEERKKQINGRDKKSKEAEKPADEGKKQVESAKMEEKKDETKEGEKFEASKVEQPPPPPTPLPQEIILKVYMHCEGCATKVRRCLKGFEGVEDVKTECRASKVVVKGEKADPLKVLERIKKKSRRQVDLISPIPKPPEVIMKPQEKEEVIKSEEKKEEPPNVTTVVLGVYMHCEACAQEIKKRIQRMKESMVLYLGVESAEADLKKSQVTVRGVFEPETLVEYLHKMTGKHAVVETEAEKEEEVKVTEGGEQEKKPEEGEKDQEAKKNKENGGGGGEPPSKAAAAVGTWDLEMKKSESYYHYSGQNHEFDPQRFVAEWPAYEYPPQMFSDENPNACNVM